MRLLENLTVKASWFLVLLFFGSMIVVLSGLGLYALQQGSSAVTAMASGAGESGAVYLEAFATMERLIHWGIVLVLAGSAVAMVAVVWGISVNVLQPLARLVGYFEGLAKGDLSQPVEKRGNNEIGRLFTALEQMQNGLSGTVGTVRSSSEGIYIGAQDIAGGNGELSARTEQQAASLAETASSMEELAATVEQNADNARQASQLAAEASETASQGGRVVSDVVATMHDISESSHKMTDIIGVIDSIAFQTNILALNASVEAARAGEHGRGFAVVAQEVRNLAGRSADAAGEIRQLIQVSREKVDAGTAQADQAGQTMGEIVAAVQRVSDIMDEIASASQEQSHGIGQVNLAVTQMDEVTQQNAALVEQAATAANQLEAEAARLREAVLRFRVTSERGELQAHLPRSAPAALMAPQQDPLPSRSHRDATTSHKQEEEEWASF